jgi:CBS domain-containing protein
MLRAMRHGDAAVPLGDFMSEGFITVRAHEVAFDVISMMENERAAVAVVLDPGAIGEPERVVGIITHRTIAASVADSIRLYGR